MKLLATTTLAFVFICSAVLLPVHVQSKDLIESTNKGTINWSKRVVSATGTGAPPQHSPDGKTVLSSKITLMAAEKQTISNLFDTILKIRITAKHTVGDFVSSDISHFSQLEAMVMHAKTIRKDYITDGTVHTTKQLAMDGGFLQLILPSDLRQFEPVKTLTQSTNADTAPVSPNKTLSGIIIDARAIDFKPVIVPVIVSENGKPVYSPVFIGRGTAVQKGLCYYTDAAEDPGVKKRTGETPLVIKGLKTDPIDTSKIIISSRDASKVLNDSENLTLLNQCKVAIITDPLSKQ